MKYQNEIDAMIASMEDEFYENPIEFLSINEGVVSDGEDYIIEAIQQLDKNILLDALEESPILREAVNDDFRKHKEYFNEKLAEYAFSYYDPMNQDFNYDD
ncbi:MAG: hypothetical protein PHS99_08785 [Candidatus Marinimicrobia bacterium]|nr:hypothetical protein [Candidatus Neomarinimicrobiota bacterium]